MQFEGKLYQVGVVVRDLDAGMRHYSTLLGLGPFKRLDTDYRARYRNWTGRIANRGRGAVVHLDTVQQLGYFVELSERSLVERLCRWIDSPADATLG